MSELNELESKLKQPKIEHAVILVSAVLGIVLFYLYYKNQANNASSNSALSSIPAGGVSSSGTASSGSPSADLSAMQNSFQSAIAQVSAQDSANNTALSNALGQESTATQTAFTTLQNDITANNSAYSQALTNLKNQVTNPAKTLSLDLSVAGSGADAGTYQSGNTRALGLGGGAGGKGGGIGSVTSGVMTALTGGFSAMFNTNSATSKAESSQVQSSLGDTIQLNAAGYNVSDLTNVINQLVGLNKSAQNTQAVEASLQPAVQPDAYGALGGAKIANTQLDNVSSLVSGATQSIGNLSAKSNVIPGVSQHNAGQWATTH